MDLREQTQAVMVKALDLEPSVDLGSLQYRDHPNWDSLGHMALIVALETEFGVEIGANELLRIESLDTAVQILRDLGVDR